MKKYFVLTVISFVFFHMTACSFEEKCELNIQPDVFRKDEKQLLNHLSYILGKWTQVNIPQKSWNDIEVNYLHCFLILQKGYGVDYINITNNLKSRVSEFKYNDGTVGKLLLFSEQDNQAFPKGIAFYEQLAEKKSESRARETLFRFYSMSSTKFGNITRSLFWAHRDAEFGGSSGMLQLAYAYATGNGVIEDAEESIKWILLAQHAGDYGKAYAKEIIKETENSSLKQAFLERQPSSLKKAKVWMQGHPDAFFTPPL